MSLGRSGRNGDGAPGRAGRLLAGVLVVALAAAAVSGIADRAQARMDDSDRDRYNSAQSVLRSRIAQFIGWYHSVGQLLLHVSNLGFFGDWDADLGAPSAEWPSGSNNEYLYAAGLWVGAVVGAGAGSQGDYHVSAAVYQQEFRPDPEDLLAVIYESWEGAAGSDRLFDDDGDCRVHVYDPESPFEWYDEDPLDGLDNDGDGAVDEDYAAISQQVYRMEYFDTYEDEVNEGAQAGDEHTSLGLKVIQESYQWTSELTDDFVGINFDVVNISEPPETLRMVYVGFMVDADAGPESDDVPWYVDDRGGFIDTTMVSVNPNDPTDLDTLDVTLAYMFDDPFGPDGNVARGYLGCMFLGHPTAPELEPGDPDYHKYYGVDGLPHAPTEVRVHAFEIWSSGTEDPRNDEERYAYLRGEADYPLLDGLDNDGDGEFDEEDEERVNIDRNAQSPQDWRFMLSAGPFRKVAPGDTLSFQYAFVMGEGLEGMLENAATAQQIYNGINQDIVDCEGEIVDSVLVHWVADTPPPPPNQEITVGDRFVRIDWDDFPEDVEDPLTRMRDFYGYQVWKAVGWTRESDEPRDQDWELILDVDRSEGGAELRDLDTGLSGIGKYTMVDYDVRNGFAYWYSVTTYDSTAEGYHFGKYTQNKTLVFPHSAAQGNLEKVRVVPNPYVNHDYIAAWNLAPDETDPTGEKVCFQYLPSGSTVRIYSLGGELVVSSTDPQIDYDPSRTGGDACWNLISRNNQIVVSGVYLYHVDSPAGEKIGKFAIIK
jgi:hypothetical protein